MQKSTFVPGTGTNVMPREFLKGRSLVAVAGLLSLVGRSSDGARKAMKSGKERKRRKKRQFMVQWWRVLV